MTPRLKGTISEGVENGRQMRDDADVVLEPFPIGQLLVDLADEPRLEEGDDDGTIVLGA